MNSNFHLWRGSGLAHGHFRRSPSEQFANSAWAFAKCSGRKKLFTASLRYGGLVSSEAVCGIGGGSAVLGYVQKLLIGRCYGPQLGIVL